MPYSYSLPLGEVQNIEDCIKNIDMASVLDYHVATPSEVSNLEYSDPAEFGFASTLETDSDSLTSVRFTISDWLSDIIENQVDIPKSVDSVVQLVPKSYCVPVDSSWYPFPNKEASLQFFYSHLFLLF